MSNMSYCRFENTLKDLQDCADHMSDADISVSEKKARKQLIEVCREIIDNEDDPIEDEDQMFDADDGEELEPLDGQI